MKDLNNKVALVTGAASGIGRAVSVELAMEGAHLVLVDVNERGLEEVQRIIDTMKRKTLTIRADVSDAEEVKALCGKVVAEMDGIDILVNVAGIGIVAEIKDMALEDWDRIIGVNLYGPIHTINGLINQMVARGSGHIVNVASGCGLVALPILGGYNTSKFGLVGFTETLRAEVARFGIGVTAVCPGAVKTNIFKSTDYREYELDGPLDFVIKYFGWKPERIARAILKGIKRNRPMLALTPMTWFGYNIKRMIPGLIYWFQKLVAGYLNRYKTVD